MYLIEKSLIYIREIHSGNLEELLYDLVGKKVRVTYLITNKALFSEKNLKKLAGKTGVRYHILEIENNSAFETLKRVYDAIKRTLDRLEKEVDSYDVKVLIDMTNADSKTFMIMFYVYLIFKDVARLVVRNSEKYLSIFPFEVSLKSQKLVLLRLLDKKGDEGATYKELQAELSNAFSNRKYGISSISKHVIALESYGLVRHVKKSRRKVVMISEAGRMLLFAIEKNRELRKIRLRNRN